METREYKLPLGDLEEGYTVVGLLRALWRAGERSLFTYESKCCELQMCWQRH